ncbi:MAG: M90 family metallopeptidase [Pseudomonadota bacterium]
MNPWFLLALGVAAIALALYIPRWRLERVLEKPFPEHWKEILERNSSFYPRLPDPLRERLHRHVQRFLHEKHFQGAGGLQIDDEIRVTIAAEACLLTLNLGPEVFPQLRWIIVYPTTFIVEGAAWVEEDGVVEEGRRDLLGESWDNGRVILAWDSVLHGARRLNDGENVVLHEFAHQLDGESGATDGAPLLGQAPALRGWAEVLSEEFLRLRHDAFHGRDSVMDEYGATNPAEFFAVATETFFERPHEMARHHEALFSLMRDYYRLDPREWH